MNRAVSFTGDLEVMYRANLWCRTALKIMRPIKSFTALNEDQLYTEAHKVAWEELMNVDDTLAVQAVLLYSNIDHSMFAALKVKDAIVERFRNKVRQQA